MFADEITLHHRVVLTEEHGAGGGRCVERNMVEVSQHSHNALPTMVFLPCRHDGEDHILGHHADIAVFRVEVAHHGGLRAFD